MPYAEGTEVSPGKSRDDIERILAKYGAASFGYLSEPGRAVLVFRTKDRSVRFSLPMPALTDRAIRFTPAERYERTAKQQQEALQQETRRRWRALHLVIKAKLEAVESGIVTFEEEFAMHFVLPDGTTVADQVLPGIATAYAGGTMPALMAGVES